MRTTGIVGILEVNQGHNRMLTIFEEELYCKGEDGSIHNERIFRVFADQESDWKNEVESAINKATNDMNPDMKAPEPEEITLEDCNREPVNECQAKTKHYRTKQVNPLKRKRRTKLAQNIQLQPTNTGYSYEGSSDSDSALTAASSIENPHNKRKRMHIKGCGDTSGFSPSSLNIQGNVILQNSVLAVGEQHGSISSIRNDIDTIQTALETALNQQLEQRQIQFLEKHLDQTLSSGKDQKSTTLDLDGLTPSLLNSLITFKNAQMSTCMIRDPTGSTGTGFLASIPTTNGLNIVFMSAGHNFKAILNSAAGPDDLYKYTLHFGNISGTRSGHIPGSRGMPTGFQTDYHQPINLGTFLEPFDVCGSISNKGPRIRFQNGKLVTNSFEIRNDDIGSFEDYCALQLNHQDVAGCLKQIGLDFFHCGAEEYLDCKHGGLVAIIGHPGIKDDGNKYPLRFSFGAEKDPDVTPNFYKDFDDVGVKKNWKGPNGEDGYPNKDAVKNYLFYDNDTFPGNSGSPVIGRGDAALGQGYCVKGIHVTSFFEPTTNGAQKIHNIEKWIDLGKYYTQP